MDALPRVLTRLLSNSVCTGLLLAAVPATGAAWTQDYGDNLWPNGYSNVNPPPGADTTTPEFAGRTTDTAADSLDLWSRVVVDPVSYGLGHSTAIALTDIWLTPGDSVSFSANALLASGARAQIVTRMQDRNGTLLGDIPVTLTTTGAWTFLGATAPFPALLPGTEKVSFLLVVWNNGFADGKAYFDNILARKFNAREIPVGTVVLWAGLAEWLPPGFLLCDGTAYSRNGYSALFQIVGVQYGYNSESDFRVPDLRGRTSVGAGQGLGLTNRPLGSTGGEEKHVLTVAEMPSHTHALGASGGNGVGGAYNITNGYSSNTADDGYPVKGTARAAGGGQAHNNMPPYTAIHYIIKY